MRVRFSWQPRPLHCEHLLNPLVPTLCWRAGTQVGVRDGGGVAGYRLDAESKQVRDATDVSAGRVGLVEDAVLADPDADRSAPTVSQIQRFAAISLGFGADHRIRLDRSRT